jgi:hypothetical protein
MQTAFDWLAIAIFAGLVVLFLHRSSSTSGPEDHIWQNAPPALGCAAGNYIGNSGLESHSLPMQILALVTLVCSVIYIFHVLKPTLSKS